MVGKGELLTCVRSSLSTRRVRMVVKRKSLVDNLLKRSRVSLVYTTEYTKGHRDVRHRQQRGARKTICRLPGGMLDAADFTCFVRSGSRVREGLILFLACLRAKEAHGRQRGIPSALGRFAT